VRVYAAVERATSDERELLQRRHALYFVHLLERAEPKLRGDAERAAWLLRLDGDYHDIWSALLWMLGSGEIELGLRLAGVMWRYWWVRGPAREGRALLEALLAEPDDDVAPAVRARALNGAGALCGHLSDGGAARAYFEESLAIRRALGDQPGVAATIHNLGVNAWYEDDGATARAYIEEALAIRRTLGDEWGAALTLSQLAQVSQLLGDYDAAQRQHEESLATFRRLGSRFDAASSHQSLGFVAIERGDAAAARRHLGESLEVWREMGYRRGIALVLAGCASLEVDRHPARALRLSAATAALMSSVGGRLPPVERRALAACYERARAMLGADLAATVWAAGEAMSLDEAVEDALDRGAVAR
jgi:tetratricopeptide (TPR) repeat protein